MRCWLRNTAPRSIPFSPMYDPGEKGETVFPRSGGHSAEAI